MRGGRGCGKPLAATWRLRRQVAVAGHGRRAKVVLLGAVGSPPEMGGGDATQWRRVEAAAPGGVRQSWRACGEW